MQYFSEGVEYYKKKLPNVCFEKPIEHDIHIRNKPLKLLNVMVKDYLRGLPYITLKFDDFKMYKMIDQMFAGKVWDVVFIDYLNMGIYKDYIQKKYKNLYHILILKDHNKEFELVKQAADKETGITHLILNREWKITKSYEESCVNTSDMVFSVCNENTEYFKKINTNSYTMLPTFEMLPHRKNVCNHNILYMGNLSWSANLSGLTWFVESVLPKIIEKIPDAQLTIVGSGPNKELFSNHANVKYLGYVQDITHIYDNQSVFIVPLFEGSGIRIKILDAFNHEIPVVSTLLGCKTIGATDEKEILIADDVVEFADCIINILTDINLSTNLSINAKKFFEMNYSIVTRQKEFIDLIDKSKDNL